MHRLALVILVAACGGESSKQGPYFEQSMFFNEDVSNARIAENSPSIIAGLSGAGGWGRGNRLQIDFSFDVLEANATTPRRTFTPMPEFFYSPDCDAMDVPIPEAGNVEGESGYACVAGGDCHLIVFDRDGGKLYEMYKADVGATTFRGGCLAVWETSRAYDETLRGDQCASADAAGFPIAPMLFTADEVAAGEIDHAIRFVLPNDRLRRGFVRPAVHGTDTDGPTNGPPYGVHLRLRADYPLDSLPNEGARVVARALQKYGMIHADGGEVALTAASDRYTTAKWAGLLTDEDLEFLRVEDFEVVDHGPMITYPYRCAR
jgi:serine/threonine-protein kinase